MDFIKTLLGSLVVGLVLAGIIIVVDAEARKDALGIIAASMILAPTAVTFIWFFKKYPKPGTQFLLLCGLLGVSVLLAILCNYFGLEKMKSVFAVGIIASVLLILTWAIVWVLRLGSKVKVTGRDENNPST